MVDATTEAVLDVELRRLFTYITLNHLMSCNLLPITTIAWQPDHRSEGAGKDVKGEQLPLSQENACASGK